MSDKIFCPVCTVKANSAVYLPARKAIRRSCVNGHLWDEDHHPEIDAAVKRLVAAWEAALLHIVPIGGGSADVQ